MTGRRRCQGCGLREPRCVCGLRLYAPHGIAALAATGTTPPAGWLPPEALIALATLRGRIERLDPGDPRLPGTHRLGYLTASCAELTGILGAPHDGGDHKTSTEWDVLYQGEPITIYDYKETAKYDPEYPSVAEFRSQPQEWHVGGRSKAAAEQFIASVLAALGRTVQS